MEYTTPETTIRIGGYQVERMIGRGGMATVYLALQESLSRHVAIKVMNPMLATEEGFKKRFLNEAQIIAKLNHPNIVTVFDFGAHEQYYYLSMAYLPGGTLKEKISQDLLLEDKLEIIKELASALAYAHQRGVVHRDVKPSNVLFNEVGTPVLTDFGIAKVAGAGTQVTATGLTLGSVGYMSPEHAMGKRVDQRSDIYSLGIVFWELLTGETPYHADDGFALALKHVTEPIPALPPNFADFQPIFNKLLAKNPEERFPDANAVIAALNIRPRPREISPANDPDATILKAPPTPRPKTGTGEIPTKAATAATSKTLRYGLAIGIALVALAATSLYFISGVQIWPPHKDSSVPRTDSASKQVQQGQGHTSVEKLLNDARRQWQAGKITGPEGDNAFESYRQILALEPQNNEAKAKLIEIGRVRLGIQYHQSAQKLLQEGSLKDSLEQVEAGLRIAPEYAPLATLKNTIQAQISGSEDTAQQQRQIGVLLAEAQRQWQAGKITGPEGDNAFESYLQILKLEPDNTEAREKLVEIGRIRLAIQYQKEAEQLLREGALQESLLKIDAGLRMAPDFPALLQLREQVRARQKRR